MWYTAGDYEDRLTRQTAHSHCRPSPRSSPRRPSYFRCVRSCPGVVHLSCRPPPTRYLCRHLSFRSPTHLPSLVRRRCVAVVHYSVGVPPACLVVVTVLSLRVFRCCCHSPPPLCGCCGAFLSCLGTWCTVCLSRRETDRFAVVRSDQGRASEPFSLPPSPASAVDPVSRAAQASVIYILNTTQLISILQCSRVIVYSLQYQILKKLTYGQNSSCPRLTQHFSPRSPLLSTRSP